jgi:cyclic pyranopterin phosphate synthase
VSSVIALPLLSSKPGPGAPEAPAALTPAPEHVRGGRTMIDSHGRTIRDLRLSITDRCNFRCVYCMEPGVRFMRGSELLSVAELVRLGRIAVGLGVEKVRVTGGEPTVHPGLADIIAGLSGAAVPDLALTTNGSLMDGPSLGAWRRAGLSRITVSIDSVRAERFAALTRSRVAPGRVIQGVREARRAGFDRVKLNAVVVRGFNEDEVAPLAGLARELGVEMRYIEFMPLDAARAWDRSRLVPASEIVERIDAAYPLTAAGREDPSSTSLLYRFADGAPGRVGVIAPVTRPFCGACSRLRITADGKVRPCLFSRDEWNVRGLLRGGASDREIAGFLADVTWNKQAGHGISSSGFRQPARTMSAIGG